MSSLVIITGESGSGKTTLIARIIENLVIRGYRIGAIKHSPHAHTAIDHKGKDTWKYTQSGAEISCLANPEHVVINYKVASDPAPQELLKFFPHMDIVLAEGYKNLDAHDISVIEVIKEGQANYYAKSPVALVHVSKNRGLKSEFPNIPHFSREDIDAICTFIEDDIIQKGG